jgi:hypothetical protein
MDGEHAGFRFDGKRQHAELCPRATDLGEITVDITLKPETKGGYTVFDFGCSEDDCLVLSIARNGKPELVATVGGKHVLQLNGKKRLATGAWANLRVEIDGKKAVLWVDGKKAGEKSTTFRPCDVFPGGGVKRNTIAAARDGKHHFAGVLDHVVIYHAVHADYAGLPEPTLDSPVRPTPAYIAALTEKYGNLKALNAKARAMEGALMAPYREMEKQSKARQQEIMDRSPEYVQAVADQKAAEEALEQRKRELTEAFDKLPESMKVRAEVNEARAKNDALRNRINILERKAFESDEQLVALRKKRGEHEAIRDRQEDLRADLRTSAPPIYREQKRAEQRLRNVEQELRGRRDMVVGKGAVDLERKVGEAKGAVVEAEEVAWKAYGPERGWLYSFNNQGYRGYYNTAYNHYLGGHAKAVVGGGEMREDTNFLEALAKAVSGDDPGWRTTVDWDWRVREEIDGSIADAPLMQKWLERVRGPVMKANP